MPDAPHPTRPLIVRLDAADVLAAARHLEATLHRYGPTLTAADRAALRVTVSHAAAALNGASGILRRQQHADAAG